MPNGPLTQSAATKSTKPTVLSYLVGQNETTVKYLDLLFLSVLVTLFTEWMSVKSISAPFLAVPVSSSEPRSPPPSLWAAVLSSSPPQSWLDAGTEGKLENLNTRHSVTLTPRHVANQRRGANFRVVLVTLWSCDAQSNVIFLFVCFLVLFCWCYFILFFQFS